MIRQCQFQVKGRCLSWGRWGIGHCRFSEGVREWVDAGKDALSRYNSINVRSEVHCMYDVAITSPLASGAEG
jgi:hypothetical protein